jgi:monofunctional biosynthetic peptidoglycan transglycosylase
VDDSARGDEPAEPKDAAPAEARPDIPLREPVAGAIPTVAPHPPRLPSQVPPWHEETVAASTASDAPGDRDDMPAEARDTLEPPPEEPVPPGAPEPSVSPPVETADDDGHPEAGPVNRALDVSAPSAALEPPAPPADAGDVGSREAHATAPPESEAAAEPDPDAERNQDAVFPEDAPPAHVEATPTAPLFGEAPVESSPPLVVAPEAHIVHDVVPPAVSDIDILLPPPSESVDNATQLTSEVTAFDERIWRDTAEVQHTAVVPAVEAAAQIIDTPPAQQPAPIPEEQIWSGPQQAVEPSLRWPQERTEPPRESSEADARSEPEPRDEQRAPQAALIAGANTPAQAPSPGSSALAAVWPSTSLPAPAPGRVGEPARYLRRAVRIAGGVVLTLTAAVLLLVVLYRWVDPPASTLMLGQQLTGTEIEQRWVPIERISPHLVQAVILSEDGGFCRHRGVDWSALEEAIESSRGGSTITMQVVKNLFLWPQRSYIRKALEIVLAYVVEMVWPKERVLEIYLNIAEWGPGIFGAEAAARSHFGRSASQLTAQEAALLAVSLPSPIERRAGYPDQQMRRLANNLLLRMRAVRAVPQCVRVRRAGG